MTDPQTLLAAYDDQLRTAAAESPSAVALTELGPLRLATYRGGRARIFYRDLGGADESEIRRLVHEVAVRCQADPTHERVEWKTRGHDRAPGLDDALRAAGFVPEEPESIMIGEARILAVEVPLPEGVTVRTVTSEADVRAMEGVACSVFGGPSLADELLATQARGDGGIELWVAEVDGRAVCSGRLEPVAGTDFAGLWGGATLPAWRGRGIYRALTAARARSALAAGKTLVNSDSTELSRPILERSGMVKVSTTTPYVWRRGEPITSPC